MSPARTASTSSGQATAEVQHRLPRMLRTVSAVRYVTPLREGGSLPALVEATRTAAVLGALIAFLMISNVATLSWTLMRPKRDVRLGVILIFGLVFAALLLEPWWTLVAICAIYLALLPYAWMRYARFKRQRATAVPPTLPGENHEHP